MRPSGTLLPLLREADWNGADLAVARRLLEAPTGRFVPWVSYAYDTGAQTLTVTEEGLREEGRDRQALEAEALQNLAARAWAFREETAGSTRVLTLVDEYAASRVLDRAALAEARVRLGPGRLVAALPARGILSLAAYEGGDTLRALSTWAVDVFRASVDTRVTPALVVLDEEGPVALLPPAVPEAMPRTCLRFERYAAEEGVAVFACHPVAGAPLPAGDLRQLRRIAATGRLDPGRPVDELHLVFDDRETAESRAAELASVDAVVLFRDAAGELREL